MLKKYFNTWIAALFIAALFFNSFGFLPKVQVADAASITVYCDGTVAVPSVPKDGVGGDEVDESLWTDADDIIVLNGGNDGYCYFDAEVSVASMTLGNGLADEYDYVFLTHTAQGWDNDPTEGFDMRGVLITTTADFTIYTGSGIDVDEKGCQGVGTGDGRGVDGDNVCTSGIGGYGDKGQNTGQGAGHGGFGGDGSQSIIVYLGGDLYGDNVLPVLFGSSGGGTDYGGTGGDGGGLIALSVGGDFVNNGNLTADAGNGSAGGGRGGGGGAGGSINVSVIGSYQGAAGAFSADGGDGGNQSNDGGGGAGGRISLRYGTTALGDFSGKFSADGGSGQESAEDGGQGSAYLKDVGSNDVTIYEGFTLDGDYSANNLTVDDSAVGVLCDGTDATPSFVAAGTLTLSGVIDCTNRSVTSFDTSVGSAMVLDGFTFSMYGTDSTNTMNVWTMDDNVPVTISNSSTITSNIQWTGLDSLSIDSTSSLIATEIGCRGVSTSNGYGPNVSNQCLINTTGYGAKVNNSGEGAGHGGAGGLGDETYAAPAGITYDSATDPVYLGSSGGGTSYGPRGGHGGGLIKISVDNTLENNGSILVDGGVGGATDRGAGGGSGGTINLSCSTFDGTDGIISADGGAGADGTSVDGGGGGGGIVVVRYGADQSNYLTGLSSDSVVAGGADPDGEGGAEAGFDGVLTKIQLPALNSITVVENTNDTTPEISVSVGGSPATYIAFSCDDGANWSDWMAYPDDDVVNDVDGPVFDVTSGATGCSDTEELKTITAKVKDAAETESSTVSDTTTYDITDPQVTNVTASNGDETYGVGVDLAIQVTFDEDVVFAGNSVDIALDFDGVDRTATYMDGTGTPTITMTYTIQNGDNKTDLAYTGTDALTLNSATLTDRAGNTAVLTLPTPGEAGSLSANKEINVSTNLVPTASVSSVAQGTDGTGDVNVSVQVDDPDDDDTLQVKVEYSLDGGSTWADPTISVDGDETTATYGDPSVDNVQTYQLGQAGAYIETSSGVNTVNFVWEAATDADAATDISNAQIRVTPYDGTAAGSASTSSDFILDFVAPTGPTTFENTAKADKSASFSWDVASDTNFSHYEIWYASYEAEVQNRTGYAVEIDVDDYSTLDEVSTTSLAMVINRPWGRYFQIYAVDDFGNYSTVAAVQVEEDPDGVGFFGGASQNPSRGDVLIEDFESEDVMEEDLIEEEEESRQELPARDFRDLITVVRPTGAVEVEIPEHWSENYLKNLGEDDRVVEAAFVMNDFFELLLDLVSTPDAYMTRGEALQIALVLGGFDYQGTEYTGVFSDIGEDHEQMQYIEYAYEQGIVVGYKDGTFKPDQVVSRVEALKIATKAYGWPVTNRFMGEELLSFYFMEEAPFVDVNMSTWYSPYLAPAVAYTVVGGYGDYFLPSKNVTYAEFVKIATLLRTAYDAVELASEME